MASPSSKLLSYLAWRRQQWIEGIGYYRRLRRRRQEARAMKVPVIFGLGREHLKEAHEPWLGGVWRALLTSTEGAVVDVGANIGQTLLKVAALDPKRPYVAFEPNPVCVFYLRKLLKANGLTHHRIVPVGLAEQWGLEPLWLNYSDHSSGASVVEGFRPGGYYTHTMDVVLARGDDCLERLGVHRVGVVKVDVEGGELEALRGLSRTLARDTPPVLLEVLPTELIGGTRHGGPSPESTPAEIAQTRAMRAAALEAFLRSMGYDLLQVGAEGRLRPVDSLAVEPPRPLAESNFLAITREQSEPIQPLLA